MKYGGMILPRTAAPRSGELRFPGKDDFCGMLPVLAGWRGLLKDDARLDLPVCPGSAALGRMLFASHGRSSVRASADPSVRSARSASAATAAGRFDFLWVLPVPRLVDAVIVQGPSRPRRRSSRILRCGGILTATAYGLSPERNLGLRDRFHSRSPDISDCTETERRI